MMKRLLGKAILSVLCGSFIASNALAQFPESFETAVPPAGWAVFNNGNGTTYDWTTNSIANTGVQCAYVNYENVTSGLAEDWMVTPQFTVSSMNSVLEFYQRQSFTTDYGSVYTIRVSTVDQTTPGNFMIVDTQTESDFGMNYQPHYVDLSAYAGQSVYVAFVMTNDDGDNWLVDDVNMVSPPCAAPSGLAANNVTTSSADLSWIPFGSGTEFNVAVVPNGAPAPTSGTAVSGTSYPASGLMQASLYDFYVQEICAQTEELIISAVYDGPLVGGTPKGIELYVVRDIPDLSIFGISSANNGLGPTGAPEFPFPAGAYSAGSYIYIATEPVEFANYFGFAPDFVNGVASINGDDAIELFKNGVVMDVFGDVNVDGTGTPWEYLDGWAQRISGSLTNGGVFNIGEWTFSGINATDGCTTNGTCASVQPIGTFTTSDNVSPWTMFTFQTDCGVLVGDEASTAFEVMSLPFMDSVNTTICYTDQINNPAPDAFFMYPIDNCIDTIDVQLCASGFDTYLWVYDQSFNLIASSDDDCGLQSAVLGLDITMYDTLYIVIEGFGSNVGNIILNIDPVSSLPAPVLLSQTDVVCGGDATGSASFGANNSSISYMWDAGTGNQMDSTAVGLSAGTYYVTATYPSGCVYMDSVTIVDLNPDIVLTAVATDETFGNDGSIDLTVVGGAGPFTYDWSNGAGSSEDPSGLDGNVTYTVIVTDNFGCTDSLEVYVGSVMGLENADLSAAFSVFPNPNNGQFIVRMSETEPVRMDIVNALGQQVSSRVLSGAETEINMSQLDKGSYTLRFTLQGGKTAFARVVLM